MATRIGVDVGGTFTDLIFYDDESGEVRVHKVPTTPRAPEDGVLRATAEALSPELMSSARYFLHGTTVGLNALLERTGAIAGLLATRGFRDVLEIRRGDRGEMYNLFWKPSVPLVPRRLRLPVTERIRADGAIHTPIEEDDIRDALTVFLAEGVTSIAVAFINSYANPEHEIAAEACLRDLGFAGDISLSHRVSGEYREYERTTTTVIDAFIRPRTGRYLSELERRLREAGFTGSALVTRSGGGTMKFAEAAKRPFETILSGPVAGAEGAAELARNLSIHDLITADVGGTSFDTCLITDGRPHVLYEGSIIGLPVQTPWVDVRSIGAGGGSIAFIDIGGLLTVGPRSAGADPGPACYGRGGTEPTVTDAAFVLGMLGHGELAGGIVLDEEKSLAALKPLAEALTFSVDEVARGMLTIAAAKMANAIREITVEQGQDPRRATLMPFGGAGPLFGTLLARELEIGQMLIPPYAGNFSAWGLLGADLMQSSARTRILRLDNDTLDEVNACLLELFAALHDRAGDAADGPRSRESALDIRYVGQEHTLTVSVPYLGDRIALDVGALREAFTREYLRTFGHTMDDPTEVVAVRAALRTVLPRRRKEPVDGFAVPHAEFNSTLPSFSFSRETKMEFSLIKRNSLIPGESVLGPAILLEETATTYLDCDFVAAVHPSGCLLVSDRTAK